MICSYAYNTISCANNTCACRKRLTYMEELYL
uniref:Uncharacterized protein n=1 Tax=Arundo donax TaxID=35708 RepID=A0A0A9H234_ARUDO